MTLDAAFGSLLGGRGCGRHIAMEVAGSVGVLKLDGGVIDPVGGVERLADALADAFALRGWHVEDANVAGESVGTRTKAPDVDIVNLAHSVHAEHHASDVREVETFGRALEQNVGGIADDADGAPKDHSRNQKGQQRIDQVLAGARDEPGPGNDADVGERVAQVMDKDGAHVDVVRVAAQQEGNRAVDQQGDGTHSQHQSGRNRFRLNDALVALVAKIERYHDQQESIHKGCENPGSLVAEGALLVRRLTLKIKRDPGQAERGQVRKIGPAIAHQPQAVTHVAGNELHRHQHQSDTNGQLDRPTRGATVNMRLRMRVRMDMHSEWDFTVWLWGEAMRVQSCRWIDKLESGILIKCVSGSFASSELPARTPIPFVVPPGARPPFPAVIAADAGAAHYLFNPRKT